MSKPRSADEERNVTLTAGEGAPPPIARLEAHSSGGRVQATTVDLPGAEIGARPAPADIPVPPSLHARFEDFRLLGRGGMGVVYRARDLKLGRDVAVKLLTSSGAAAPGGLLQEARAQARLRHENACEVYDAGVADHVPYIVMQLIDGTSLFGARDAMTLEQKVGSVRMIAAALHEAHRQGLVHRDVKPSNILVERCEDGSLKPYILDFGIAREVLEGGPTLTGAGEGTPAFMAPEQATGAARSIDRRTDVYGLGATLYAVIAGRPPFVAEAPLALMRMVIEEEPPPLRLFHPAIARDLEAIVMRCLEKDPGARYASARALGEDLQRFLDGDPVTARPPSWTAILRRRARRHKVAVAGAALLAAVALIVAGQWYRGRRVAAEQAQLGRELGESITEMELFLRAAHGMPLHDVEREREVVRGRLRGIEARLAGADEISAGPGHDALGRGLLALGEARAALDHFQQAERSGYRSRGLDYAMGVALSALYKQALDSTSHIQGEAQRRARVTEIEARYKAPAILRLKAALNNPVVSTAYVEGLIALHEGRNEVAHERAETAFGEAPWLHEAKKLAGDALFALGSRHRADKSFNYEEAMRLFERAAETYAAAADLGRSDPAVHAAECELWTQIMNAASEHGSSMRPSFDRARAACDRAIRASPRSAEAHARLAWVHNCFAWWVATGRREGEDLQRALRDAEASAAEAVARGPNDVMARYTMAAVARTRALDALNRGLDAAGALALAVDGYEAALRLEPDFSWALNELCSTLAMRGKHESIHGEDPRASFSAAFERCERAISQDPEFMYPKVNQVLVSLHEADHLVSVGRSPEEPVRRGLALVEAASRQNPTWDKIPIWRARLLRASVLHALASGGDPDEPLAAAEAASERLAPESSYPRTAETRGLVKLLRARVQLARGRDPEPALGEARAALGRAVLASPFDVDDRLWLAAADLVAFRWTERQRRPDRALLDAAEATLAVAHEDRPIDDPRVSLALAEIRAARAGIALGP